MVFFFVIYFSHISIFKINHFHLKLLIFIDKPKSTQNTSVKNVVSNVPKLENIESVNATKEQLSSLIYLLNNNNQLVESDQAKILSTLTNAAAFATNMGKK